MGPPILNEEARCYFPPSQLIPLTLQSTDTQSVTGEAKSCPRRTPQTGLQFHASMPRRPASPQLPLSTAHSAWCGSTPISRIKGTQRWASYEYPLPLTGQKSFSSIQGHRAAASVHSRDLKERKIDGGRERERGSKQQAPSYLGCSLP